MRPFQKGDRVFNTRNRDRKIIGIVTRVIDADWCEVLWSDGEGYAYDGRIRRDGSVNYSIYIANAETDRIVRVKLSVRIPNVSS